MHESMLLAGYISDTDFEALPANAVAIAKKCFLDALAVMLAAGTLGEGCREFVNLAVAGGGKEESTILGFDRKVPAAMAAFANGAMAHALDYEDVHDTAFVHPNAATIPAALAVAESLGNTCGRDFLAAIILGSDLVCRLGLALKKSPLELGWYIPPILGAFGAAAAAGKLLKLTAGQMLDAFSLTLCQATCSAELIHNPGSVVRSIRDAFAAKAGVISALLARAGVTGFKEPLEGKAGLFNLYAAGNYDSAILLESMGKVFASAAVSFKPWPSCRGTHPYIDAILQLVEEYGLQTEDIREIGVLVSPMNRMLCEPAETKRRPQTAIDAKFSIPFVVATAACHRRVALEHFTPGALENERVLDLAGKVFCEVDTALTLKESMQSRVEIKTPRGTLAKSVRLPYGHPQNPMSNEALTAKFLDCARYAAKKIPAENLQKLIELIMNLEQVENIGLITALL